MSNSGKRNGRQRRSIRRNDRSGGPAGRTERGGTTRPQNASLGQSPGTLTYVGQAIHHATHLIRVEYSPDDYHVDESGELRACQLPAETASHVTWLNVDGIHEPNVVAALGERFHLHPLLLEDVMNTQQKPKLEQYDDATLFVTLKMLYHDDANERIDAEHVSFILGSRFLISFQEERTGDIFAPVLARIKASAGKTRRNGPDYLLYALMDLMIDHYFAVLEQLGDDIDTLEDSIMQGATGQPTLQQLYALKRELATLRRAVWPLRDMLGNITREENPLIQSTTQPFLRDLYDHVTQVIETADAYRDLTASLLDVYLSTVSNRMNAVMKTLTIFSAIFMPLTFIVGVYGMNFEHMPELQTRYGYYVVWGVMALTTAGLLTYFKRRGWM